MDKRSAVEYDMYRRQVLKKAKVSYLGSGENRGRGAVALPTRHLDVELRILTDKQTESQAEI